MTRQPRRKDGRFARLLPSGWKPPRPASTRTRQPSDDGSFCGPYCACHTSGSPEDSWRAYMKRMGINDPENPT